MGRVFGEERQRGWRVAALVGGAAVAVALVVGPGSSSGAGGALVPVGERVAGRTYGQWEVEWWRWRLSLSKHHAAPNGSSCATADQHGSIWFLGGDADARASSTRRCFIPAGRFLILGVPTAECSTVEAPPFHAKTDTELQRCARRIWPNLQGPTGVTLDGVALNPPSHAVGSPAFALTIPTTDNFLGVHGHSHGRGAAYGRVTILRPLPRGTHTLVAPFDVADAPLQGTYTLIVG
jgi:hypothetical protein